MKSRVHSVGECPVTLSMGHGPVLDSCAETSVGQGECGTVAGRENSLHVGAHKLREEQTENILR